MGKGVHFKKEWLPFNHSISSFFPTWANGFVISASTATSPDTSTEKSHPYLWAESVTAVDKKWCGHVHEESRHHGRGERERLGLGGTVER